MINLQLYRGQDWASKHKKGRRYQEKSNEGKR